MPFGGGRTWWAHFEFTSINIGPTILRKKIDDLREAGTTLGKRCDVHSGVIPAARPV
jgi:hypothetical protein